MIKNYPILKSLVPLFFLLFSYSAFSQTVLYSENFESGGGGWGVYIGVGGGNTKWNYSNATEYNTGASGKYVFTDPYYAKNILNGVVSPVINLAGYSNITFQFDIWYDTEVNYDGMIVQYSLNGGGTWNNLGSVANSNWYNSNINTFSASNGWSGDSQGWVTRSINLSEVNILFNSSSQFQFRVIFSSRDFNGLNTNYVGVAFDNILIIGNSGIDFDATKKNYVDFGDNHKLVASAPFSLEAWVLQKTLTTGKRTIISKGNAQSGNLRGYHLSLNNGIPTLTWYNNTGDLILNIVSPYAITNGKWHHITATYDGITAKIYVDGVDVVPAGVAFASIATESQPFLIGAMYDSSAKTNPQNYFNGYIDEVRVWDVALSAQQIREMMNQEIEVNAVTGKVKGKKIPRDISGVGLAWTNLKGYYPMNDNTTNDKSGNLVKKNGSTRNMVTIQPQTAPLPYKSMAGGVWDATTTWENGSVQNLPNGLGINGSTKVEWNIVQTTLDITSGARDITVLGLISTAGKLTIDGDNALGTGQALRVTHYLELDGEIDLVGESQLLQDTGSILDADSGGFIERDQQGTASSFNYNYWSSSVGPKSGNTLSRGTGLPSVNAPFTIKAIINDGRTAMSPTIVYGTSPYAADTAPGTQLIISNYWLYQYYGKDDDYNSWFPRINENAALAPGVGYTMKGSSGKVPIANQQNYVFRGKPYNGDVTLKLEKAHITPSGDVDRLIGNPYPSAIDATEFILDNLSVADGGTNTTGNIFNGALYFWDHFGEINTHILREYVGGYATRNLTAGAPAISNDSRINNNLAEGTKIPQQYIPVNQGFFVGTKLGGFLNNNGVATPSISGGDIVFKNSQRVFKKETPANSVFMKSVITKDQSSQKSEENTNTRPIIRLLYDSPTGYHRQIVIGMVENTSNHFDLGYDAPMADINKEDMYWTFDGARFVIQGVPNFNNEQEFPLGLKIAKFGLASIKIDAIENMDENLSVHIKDKLTGETHNISRKPFEIDLAPGIYLDRFSLTFTTQKLIAEDVIAEVLIPATSQPIIEGIHVFMNNAIGELQIKNNSTEEIVSVALINSLGQTVKTWNSNFNIRTISLPVSTATGVFLVQINTKTGNTVKKISVE